MVFLLLNCYYFSFSFLTLAQVLLALEQVEVKTGRPHFSCSVSCQVSTRKCQGPGGVDSSQFLKSWINLFHPLRRRHAVNKILWPRLRKNIDRKSIYSFYHINRPNEKNRGQSQKMLEQYLEINTQHQFTNKKYFTTLGITDVFK